MKTWIALFRGINVGGNHVLPMKELTAVLEGLGCRNVRTYIQSGNVVFDSSDEDVTRLPDQIRAEIGKRRDFEPSVLILSVKEFENVVRNNPFPEAEQDPASLHVGFLASTPKNPDLKQLENLKKESERFRLIGRAFYLHAPEGVGRSKLAASSERVLGAPMTDRNWRTVCKIMKLTGK